MALGLQTLFLSNTDTFQIPLMAVRAFPLSQVKLMTQRLRLMDRAVSKATHNSEPWPAPLP
jgi:hypothetical protein